MVERIEETFGIVVGEGMDFRCNTKELDRKQQVFVKIVADPMEDESRWLPACNILGNTDLIRRSPAPESQSKSKAHSVFSAFTNTIHAGILALGQIFMMCAVATACGGISCWLFGQSYDRVMYHSGPQDTFVGVFTLAAIPLFWTGWFLHKRKWLKLTLLLTLLPAATSLFCNILQGLPAILLAVFTFACLAAFLYSGSYLSSWKNSWPRKFKPTRWLSFCYVTAVAMLALEWQDRSDAVTQIPLPVLLTSLLTIMAFTAIPAILTSISAGTKRLASAFGLALVGQMPLLSMSLIYCIANAVMLACHAIIGPSVLADYFASTAPGGMAPDFDIAASNSAELISKLVSSIAVFVSLLLSLWSGSALGVMWTRRKTEHNKLEQH